MRGFYYVLVFCIVSLVLFLVASVIRIAHKVHFKRMKTAKGIITEVLEENSEKNYSEVQFSYQVDEKEYNAKAKIKLYSKKIGDNIKVYYPKNNPEKGEVRKEEFASTTISFLAIIFLILALLLLLLTVL